jgi:hypothetical protein
VRFAILDPLEAAGIATLTRAARSAIVRRVATGQFPSGDEAFTTRELIELADHLASVMAVANLAGRYRIYDLARKSRRDEFHKFNEPWWSLQSIAKLFRPKRAIDFFRSIMPIDFNEPLFAQLLSGRAFGLAVTTSNVVRQKVAKVIENRLETGQRITTAPREIDEILDSCRIPHKNGYGEMVFRTNMMESYREGGWDQFNSPNIVDVFPAWQYTGIADGRERQGPEPQKPDHHRHFRKVWPRGVSFFDVRGREARDVIHCRCDFIPMDDRDLKRFLADGGVMQEGIPGHGE